MLPLILSIKLTLPEVGVVGTVGVLVVVLAEGLFALLYATTLLPTRGTAFLGVVLLLSDVDLAGIRLISTSDVNLTGPKSDAFLVVNGVIFSSNSVAGVILTVLFFTVLVFLGVVVLVFVPLTGVPILGFFTAACLSFNTS